MKTNWIPLFDKIVDSSLWLEEDFVVKVFLTMIFKKDRDNVVRGNAFNISRWANKSELEVVEAIKILCSPDMKRSESQHNEGRRLQKVEGGWLILNGQYYHEMMMAERRKVYKKEYQAQYRKSKKQRDEAAAIAAPLTMADINTIGANQTGPENI